jgi:predicted Rossmann fold flavoprotein
LDFDAIVLGAGAAGLFCAAIAGQRGRRVLLLEHNASPGRKILISGGGRCNFTNRQVSAANFLSANPHFAKSALARYTPQDFLALLARHRVAWHEKTLGQLFCDDSARQVLDLLLAECAAGGVDLRHSGQLRDISRDTGFTVETSAGRFTAPALVVATGGLSIPKMGATGFGYRVAEQFGLPLVPPRPALVPFTFSAAEREAWCDLAGVSLEVEARAGKARFREKMLVTHRGLSGPAILQISSYWQPPAEVTLDLLPGVDLSQEDPAAIRSCLSTAWPERFARRWLEREGLTQQLISPRRANERVHRWSPRPAGTEGFEKAEVTAGGVDTAALSSSTMEARNVPGLFFVGEVVDVTGWLGGYNFQWAWSSAFAAAHAL